jgi:hypothetical protein
MAVLGTAHAAEDKIATWTDADGTTHFGDAQFAPPTATAVEVTPVNGMTAPEEVSNRSSQGPVWTVIDQAPKQNKVGWRSKGAGPQSGHVSRSQR